MAKAKKLPSGQWRTLVYNYTDENGKRHYQSFTSDTKKESEFMAAEFALNKKAVKKEKIPDIPFRQARKGYIKSNINVLSPSTLRGYKQMQTYFEILDNIHLPQIDQEKVQEWINEFSKTHAPKTVKNAHGFISSILRSYDKTFKLHSDLPKMSKTK